MRIRYNRNGSNSFGGSVPQFSTSADAQRRTRKYRNRIYSRTAEFAGLEVSAEKPKPKSAQGKDFNYRARTNHCQIQPASISRRFAGLRRTRDQIKMWPITR